jgi:peptide/nickel transport system ATP-binding protein
VNDAALRIDDLRVTFVSRSRILPVVKGVSLEIAPGSTYGLVGESGCGKTTLALALMSYLPRNGRIDGGSVTIGGEDVFALSKERLRELRGTKLAMVYQDPSSALNPSIRVGEQIAEVFRFHEGLSVADARVRARESLERVAMPDAEATLKRYPFQLSGGQQQRVVIAMALAGNPRLLVLDEPTTGLDATVEAEVLDLIEELRGKVNAAILLISHNLGLVARLCEEVGVMYAGRIVEQGPSKELFTDPRHPYTMGLLRCLPRFGGRKDQISLEPIPGVVPPLGTTMPGCVYASRCSLAQAACTRREPDLFPWPGAEASAARAAAETAPPDPAAPSPNDARPVGNARHHTRCYVPEQVPGMIISEGHAQRVRARTQHGGELLRTVGVSKVFGDGARKVVAVDDVTIEVVAGETFGLVGESGSGKTTFANVIAGLFAADGGEVRFVGKVLAGEAAHRDHEVLRTIQMVFQNPDSTLNPSWSVRNILGRSVVKLSETRRKDRRKRVEELAQSVSLGRRYLDNKPAQLSGGQKQRAAIARAFAGSPALVLCDEPASALDVSVQATILNLLADLQAEHGVSYIFISHDLAVVRYLSDRIGVMYLAWLMEIGGAEQVFSPPHHPYTEALVSAIPTLDFEHPQKRIPLHGAIPSLSSPPSGCRFHTRCHRFLGDICVNALPPWREVTDGHRYRCHIPPDELRDMQLGEGHAASP